MSDSRAPGAGGLEGAAAEFIPLIVKAVAAGVASSLLAALLVLGLASTAEAAQSPGLPEPGSEAPAPPPSEGGPSGAGALWAAAQMPQGDAAESLQMLFGLLALAAAGMFAVIGRGVPAAGGQAASPRADPGGGGEAAKLDAWGASVRWPQRRFRRSSRPARPLRRFRASSCA